MTISDETRYQLHQRLDAVLGAEEAGTLMAYLPPLGWADVAMRRDLDHAVTMLRSELAVGLAGLRTELREVETGIRRELHDSQGAIRRELRDELRGVEVGIRSELHDSVGSLRSQQQTLFFGLVGLQASAAGIALAISQLS